MDFIKVGKIIDYSNETHLAVFKINTEESIKEGDYIRIGEFGSGLMQQIGSMQKDNEEVRAAFSGQKVSLQVSRPVNLGDYVYKASL